jgi:hypothetical protein
MSIPELQGIEQKQRILSRFVEMRSRWLRAIRLAKGDRRSQISGQTTAQPKTKLRLGSNSSSPPPQKNGILCYILISIYISPSNGNLPGSVTAIKLYNKAVQVSRKNNVKQRNHLLSSEDEFSEHLGSGV